jgi:hypothetical protein
VHCRLLLTLELFSLLGGERERERERECVCVCCVWVFWGVSLSSFVGVFSTCGVGVSTGTWPSSWKEVHL